MYELLNLIGLFCLGIQQSPAVGRAMAEMILDGGFTTIDLTRLGFDRILLDKPIREQNCF